MQCLCFRTVSDPRWMTLCCSRSAPSAVGCVLSPVGCVSAFLPGSDPSHTGRSLLQHYGPDCLQVLPNAHSSPQKLRSDKNKK